MEALGKLSHGPLHSLVVLLLLGLLHADILIPARGIQGELTFRSLAPAAKGSTSTPEHVSQVNTPTHPPTQPPARLPATFHVFEIIHSFHYYAKEPT